MPDPLGPITIDGAGKFILPLPQGIEHGDYIGVVIWNTSGYIINIVPSFNEAGSFSIPPSNGVVLKNDWDLQIPFTVINPGTGTPVSGVLAGSVYYNNETLPPPPNINPAQIAAIVESGTMTVTGTVDVSSGTIDIGNSPAVIVDSGTIDIGNTPTINIASGQVVNVQNSAGGALTVAGTVDANVAGNVTIDTGTVNIQPVEGKLLASPTGPGGVTVTVDITATALYITGPITANIQVNGVTSETIYTAIYAGGGVANYGAMGLWVCPINPALDTNYAVQSSVGSGISWSITEVFIGATTLLTPVVDGGPNEVLLGNYSGSSCTVPFDSTTEVILIYAYDVLGFGGGLDNCPTIQMDLANPNPNMLEARPISHAVDSTGHQSTIWEVEVLPSVQQQVQIVWTGSTTWSVSKRSRSTGWPTYKGTYIATLTNPAVATDVSYTLPFDARIRRFMGEFQANSGLNGQSAYLLISGQTLSYGGYIPLTGKVAYTYNRINAWIGGPTGIIAPESGALNVIEAPLPDMVLSAGTQIATFTFSMGATDQWNHVQIALEAA